VVGGIEMVEKLPDPLLVAGEDLASLIPQCLGW